MDPPDPYSPVYEVLPVNGRDPQAVVTEWLGESDAPIVAVPQIPVMVGEDTVVVEFVPGAGRDVSAMLGEPEGTLAVVPRGNLVVHEVVRDRPVLGSTLVRVTTRSASTGRPEAI